MIMEKRDVMDAYCPYCHSRIPVSVDATGTTVRCPECRRTVEVSRSNEEMEEMITQWIVTDVKQMTAMRRRHEALVGRR